MKIMYTLKSYIRNRARPEASIAEGYLADEFMTFCSRYFDNSIQTKFNRPHRNYENPNDGGGALGVFCHPGRALGAKSVQQLSRHELNLAHIYILKNCDEVQRFIEEFSQVQVSDVSEEEWCENFRTWFKQKISHLYEHDKSKEMEDLLSLSRGPTQYVTSSSGYIINGYRFHIESREKTLKTQNSGLVVIGNSGEQVENIDYYGVVTEILELQYLGGNRVVLFRCKWFDVYDELRGVKTDEYGFVSVNSNRQLKTNEPFVLGSQATQVFYATDNVNKGWQVALKTQPRNVHEMLSDDESESGNHQGETCEQDIASSSGAQALGKRRRSL